MRTLHQEPTGHLQTCPSSAVLGSCCCEDPWSLPHCQISLPRSCARFSGKVSWTLLWSSDCQGRQTILVLLARRSREGCECFAVRAMGWVGWRDVPGCDVGSGVRGSLSSIRFIVLPGGPGAVFGVSKVAAELWKTVDTEPRLQSGSPKSLSSKVLK